MYDTTQKRRYTRIEHPYITRFRVKPNATVDMAQVYWDMVAVNNLSAGGLFFHARKDWDVGMILDLKIGFSISRPSILCVGKVIRTKRHLNTSIIGFAIEFTEIDKHIKEVIHLTASQTDK
ncbi:MAG: PilZ domain-containing protein [Candidatus Brocadiaceae bacterium]|nr:PilZ domain-containing protein [Candidatus Brocadiaceae bacterium]